MVDYSKAKIYQILNDTDDDVYVGSTCQSLSMRMVGHKRSMKYEPSKKYPLYQKMNKIGAHHFYIELIEETPCENKEQLRAVEGEYIRSIGTLNLKIAARTQKRNYEDNKDRILEDRKSYRENHKEELTQYHKKKWAENKPKLQIKNQYYYNLNKHKTSEKVECPECGIVISQSSMKRHMNRKHS